MKISDMINILESLKEKYGDATIVGTLYKKDIIDIKEKCNNISDYYGMKIKNVDFDEGDGEVFVEFENFNKWKGKEFEGIDDFVG